MSDLPKFEFQFKFYGKGRVEAGLIVYVDIVTDCLQKAMELIRSSNFGEEPMRPCEISCARVMLSLPDCITENHIDIVYGPIGDESCRDWTLCNYKKTFEKGTSDGLHD